MVLKHLAVPIWLAQKEEVAIMPTFIRSQFYHYISPSVRAFDEAAAFLESNKSFMSYADYLTLQNILDKRIEREKKLELTRKQTELLRQKEQREKELQRDRKRRQRELRRETRQIRDNIRTALRTNNRREADRLFFGQKVITSTEYSKIKLEVEQELLQEQIDNMRAWFSRHVRLDDKPFTLDNEQATAVIDSHSSTLLKARAGSGKTRVIVAKIIYLIAHQGLKPRNIKVFVFNKKARQEINDRLKRVEVDSVKIFQDEIEIATTFHGFAHSVVDPGSKILENKASFVGDIIEHMKESGKSFCNDIYKFFRDESFRIDHRQFKDADHYYEVVRNQTYRTLDGKTVKSNAEKIIADFFFENDVKYWYEREYYPKTVLPICRADDQQWLAEKDMVKPDFFLPDYNCVWEHWAITGEETPGEIREFNQSQVAGDYNEYRDNMKWKRWFYLRKWRDSDKQPDNSRYQDDILTIQRVIGTYRPREMSREQFEDYLREKCARNNIVLHPKSQDKLIREVWRRARKQFTRMIVQFIDRAQQKYDDINRLDRDIAAYNGDDRTKAFLRFGQQIYREYLEALAAHDKPDYLKEFSGYGLDFNQLMTEATVAIKSGQHDSELNDIQVIMIDEYQDFSHAFFDLVVAMRTRQPKTSLFCVGDDWQMINRFTGSDDQYFNNFSSYFDNATVLNMTTNYRGNQLIVENSNRFMRRFFAGEPSRSSSIQHGEVKAIDVNVIKVDNREQYEEIEQKSDDNKRPFIAVKYAQKLREIINDNPNSAIMVLHRKNDMSFDFMLSLEKFVAIIGKVMTNNDECQLDDFKKHVEVMTIHGAKGLEADVVVLLEANDGVIPMFHPDNSLYEIFGDDEQLVYHDQARLFYVAITRATHKLYVLYDGKKDASFAKILKGGQTR
jgi:DNA helicase-4